MKSPFGQTVALASAIALVAACSGSLPATPTPSVSAVTVTLTPRIAEDRYHGDVTFYGRGQTRQLIAVATLSDGTSETVTNSAMWNSSHPGVVALSETGLATSIMAPGVRALTATITATYQGTSGTLRVTVAIPD